MYRKSSKGALIVKENEGIRVREARWCLLCGNEGTLLYAGMRDRLFYNPANWQLMRCNRCELVWLNPCPIPEDFDKLYCEYFTHQVENNPTGALAGLRKYVKETILWYRFGYQIKGSRNILGSFLSMINPLREIIGGSVMWLKANNGGILLDVGCGNGVFLDQMKHLGWKVIGVEPDGNAALCARETYGLEVFQGSLEEAKFPDDSIDAITMSHVIEHVDNPIGVLKECRRVLKPGGYLVITTPNIHSYGCHIFEKEWLHWDPPRHLYLFSPKSLCETVGRADLAIQDLHTLARSVPWMWAASSTIRRNGMLPSGLREHIGPMVKLKGLAVQIIEYSLFNRKQAGEEIVMVAKKLN